MTFRFRYNNRLSRNPNPTPNSNSNSNPTPNSNPNPNPTPNPTPNSNSNPNPTPTPNSNPNPNEENENPNIEFSMSDYSNLLIDFLINREVATRNNFNNILNETFTNNRKKYKKVICDHELNKLKIEKYNSVDTLKKNYNKECIFTLNEFEEEENIIKLPCNHIFNDKQIINWLENESNTCPICRYEFDYKEINTEPDYDETNNDETNNDETNNDETNNEETNNLIMDENIPFLSSENERVISGSINRNIGSHISRNMNNMLFLNYPINNNNSNNSNNNNSNNSNNLINEFNIEYTNFEIMQQEYLINYYNRLRNIR